MSDQKRIYRTLISVAELAPNLYDPEWVVLDCRFALAEPEKGRQDYLLAHIPGAVYARLDEDLSGVKTPGVTSRHPLPDPQDAARTFGAWGIRKGVQVVVYDDAGGALAAARAWWMLRWLGHDAVAVLDGGWQKWLEAGLQTRAGQETRTECVFEVNLRPEKLAGVAEVARLRDDPAFRLLDARSSERFHGQNEVIDPVAGHIPGAISAPYADNLNADQTFRSPQELRTHYQRLLGEIPAERCIAYCGSGVTANHNILAMMHAGLGEGRLYAGSWSEWITDKERPVARKG